MEIFLKWLIDYYSFLRTITEYMFKLFVMIQCHYYNNLSDYYDYHLESSIVKWLRPPTLSLFTHQAPSSRHCLSLAAFPCFRVLYQWFSASVSSNYLGSLLAMQISGPHLRDAVGLGWGLEPPNFNRLPKDMLMQVVWESHWKYIGLRAENQVTQSLIYLAHVSQMRHEFWDMEVRHTDLSALEGLQSSELTILMSNQQGWAKRRKKFANET